MPNDEGMTNGVRRASRREPDVVGQSPRRAYASRLAERAIGRHCFVVGISSFVIAAAAYAMPTPAQQLHALFAEDWQWRLHDQPERATVLGDHRYGDRLTDLSPETIAARREHARDMLRRLSAIDRAQLAERDLLSYDLFRFEQQLAVDA